MKSLTLLTVLFLFNVNSFCQVWVDEGAEWDFYFSMKSGVVIQRYTSNYDDDPTDIDVQLGAIDIKENSVFFYIGPVLGTRYYLNEKFAFFGEIGRSNLSNMTIGASMKL